MINRFNRFCNQYVKFVYVMVPVCHWTDTITWVRKYMHIVKIGISDDVNRRIGEVKADIKSAHGNRVFVVAMKIPFLSFYNVEQQILRITARFYGRAEMPGAGKTEWRLCRNWITALAICWFAKPMDGNMAEVWRFLLLVLMPVPLDFYLFACAAFLLEISIVGGAVWAAYFLLSHLQF